MADKDDKDGIDDLDDINLDDFENDSKDADDSKQENNTNEQDESKSVDESITEKEKKIISKLKALFKNPRLLFNNILKVLVETLKELDFKNSKLHIILLEIAGIFIIAVGAVFITVKILKPLIHPEFVKKEMLEKKQKKQKKILKNKKDISILFPLEPIIVNLTSKTGQRYLRVTIVLSIGKKNVKNLTKNMPHLQDLLIELLSSKTYEDINGIEDKYILKGQIIMKIKEKFNTKDIYNLYFTEFIIQ